MKMTQENRIMAHVARRCRRVGAGRCRRRAAPGAQNAIQSITSIAAGRHRGRAHRAVASRWPRCRAASRSRRRRASPSTCPASATRIGRNAVEINQGNLRSVERRAGRRPHAAGAEPEAGVELPRAAAGQDAAAWLLESGGGTAGDRRRARRRSSRRRRTTSRRRCATSTSAAAPTAPAASIVEPAEHPGRRRHPPAGPEPGGRVPALDAARQPAPPARRHRLRHAGPDRLDASRAATACAWSSSRAAPGSTAPTRATTSSCSRCGRSRIDPNKLTQGPGFQGEKLSLNFQNIEVRALLQVIADFTNFNVVTSDTVTGNVTLRLKDVPWDQALDIILQAKGLGVRKNGNVLWIAPKDELRPRSSSISRRGRRSPTSSRCARSRSS